MIYKSVKFTNEKMQTSDGDIFSQLYEQGRRCPPDVHRDYDQSSSFMTRSKFDE